MFPDESDEEEDAAGSSAGKSSGGKKERFFWQYNVQAKVRVLKKANAELTSY